MIGDDVLRMRRLRAAALVIAILVVVPGIEVVLTVVAPSQLAGASNGGLDSRVLLSGDDPLASLERIEGIAEPDDFQLPEWYADEVGILPDARDVRANEDGSVVGYVVSGSSGAVLACLSEYMESRGWISVSLGGTEGATFVKEKGQCTWVLVTCTQVGGDTSVVARCKVK